MQTNQMSPLSKLSKLKFRSLWGHLVAKQDIKQVHSHTKHTHTQSCIRTKSLSLMIMDNSFRAALFNTSIQGLQYARLLVHFIV